MRKVCRHNSIHKIPALDTFLEGVEETEKLEEANEDQVFAFIESVIKAIEESGIADGVEPEMNKVQNAKMTGIMSNLLELANERMGDVEGQENNKIIQTLKSIKLGSDVGSHSRSDGNRVPSNPAFNRKDI